MSVYKNPKDGSTLSQMPKIATNIEMVDQPQEDFVTEGELESGLATKVDWVTQGKLGAKNLIPFPYPESTLSRRGVDWTVNNDGSILANGEIGAGLHYSYIKVGSFTKVKEGAYVISISPSPNEIYIESRLEGAQGIIKRYGESHDYNGFAFTITSDDASLVNENDDVYFVINIIVNDNRGTVVDNVLLYPMMRYATDTDNTYQPYAPTNYELFNSLNNLTNGFEELSDDFGSIQTALERSLEEIRKISGTYLPILGGNSNKYSAQIGETAITFDASEFMASYSADASDLVLEPLAKTQTGDVIEYKNVTVSNNGVVTVTVDALTEAATFICKCSMI